MGRVEGKVCIVTGGADGLGRADAEVLVREGAIVVIADLDAERGEAAACDISGACSFVRHDVRSEEQWIDLIGSVMGQFGSIDVLVNNAGVLRFEDLEDTSLDSWRFVQSVNVEGTFLGCKHALPAMRRSGGGSIVNVCSSVVFQSFGSSVSYSASKGAVWSMSRALAAQCRLRGDPIRVNTVHPHRAETRMSVEAIARRYADVEPGARPVVELGSPYAVANAVLFLASDESSDLNGTAINLDRGTAVVPSS